MTIADALDAAMAVLESAEALDKKWLRSRTDQLRHEIERQDGEAALESLLGLSEELWAEYPDIGKQALSVSNSLRRAVWNMNSVFS